MLFVSTKQRVISSISMVGKTALPTLPTLDDEILSEIRLALNQSQPLGRGWRARQRRYQEHISRIREGLAAMVLGVKSPILHRLPL